MNYYVLENNGDNDDRVNNNVCNGLFNSYCLVDTN